MKPKDLLDDLESGDRSMEHLEDRDPEPNTQTVTIDGNTFYISSTQAQQWGTTTWGQTDYTAVVHPQQYMQMAQQQNVANTAASANTLGGLGQMAGGLSSGTLSGMFQQSYGDRVMARIENITT